MNRGIALRNPTPTMQKDEEDSRNEQRQSVGSKIDILRNSVEGPGSWTRSSSGSNSERPSVQFPWRLHELLTESETNGNDTIISWIPGTNNAFKVHDKEKFTNEILPAYFNATKYKSFQRNLNLWGFESITEGPNKGGCQHPVFIRGDREKCHYMTRHRVRGPKQKQVESSEESQLSQHDDYMKRAALSVPESNRQLQSLGLNITMEMKGLSFCEKLHVVLSVPELHGCIRWTPDGRCIAVVNPYQFNGVIFSAYFPNTTFPMFLSALESYGFQKLAYSGFQDCYYHDVPSLNSLLQGRVPQQPSLSEIIADMRRQGVDVGNLGTGRGSQA
eukprot:scaffold5380_cov131-Cylindrotheca_fusiformis.AAC.32